MHGDPPVTPPDYRVVHVTKVMPHHREAAGYNRLLFHLHADARVRAVSTPGGRAVNALTRRLLGPAVGSEWYGLAAGLGELRAAARCWRRGPTLVHILYGEDLLGFAPALLGPQHRVVATFHQPPERSQLLLRKSRLWRALDAAITLDAATTRLWEERLPGRVHPLSLGVDVHFFRPAREPEPQPTVLFVGNHLRDFDLLRAAVPRLAAQRARFELVVSPERVPEVVGLPNTRVRAGITDGELLAAYQRAALVLVPLRAAGASNVILQALACGLPLVVSDHPGVRTYLDASCARLIPPHDVDACVVAVKALLDDPAERKRLAIAARARAMAFTWERLAERHRACYDEIAAAPSARVKVKAR